MKKKDKSVLSGELFIWNKFFVYRCLCTVETKPLKKVGLYKDHQLKSDCTEDLWLNFMMIPPHEIASESSTLH